MNKNCLFCNAKLDSQREPVLASLFGEGEPPFFQYICDYCGEYWIDLRIDSLTHDQKVMIASYLQTIKLNKYLPAIITYAQFKSAFTGKKYPVVAIEEMLDQFPKRVDEKLNRALQNLGKLSKERIGTIITVYFNQHAILYALDKTELTGILDALKDNGYIRYYEYTDPAYRVIVTAKGFDRIYELDKVNPASHQGFVAMWFDSSMDNAYKNGFQKAIEDAGYEPRRIDKEEFIGDIDDKIIAEIRRSKFLVADFTDFRSGVFYESGFAKGLGIDVIFTCREDQKDKIKEHFDTRQKKHILWRDEVDLYKQLLNIITANIGWGPQAKKEDPK